MTVLYSLLVIGALWVAAVPGGLKVLGWMLEIKSIDATTRTEVARTA